MRTNDNGRAEARSRANRRLHRMTIGTTLLGVAATGAFGWLAAVTDDGTTSGATAIVSTIGDTATANGTATSSTTGTTGSTSTTSTAPALTGVQGGAQASTGGS